jgi:hypothetical protein
MDFTEFVSVKISHIRDLIGEGSSKSKFLIKSTCFATLVIGEEIIPEK